MKKIKKSIQNHKKAWIIGICIFFAVLIIFFTVFFIAPIFSNNTYGDRLDDIDNYEVSDSDIEKIEEQLNEKDGVTDVTYRDEGRILNFIIEFEDDFSLDTAKQYASIVIDNISEENLGYYDVQIFLNADSDGFPIIGYHAKGSDSITWGNVGEDSE